MSSRKLEPIDYQHSITLTKESLEKMKYADLVRLYRLLLIAGRLDQSIKAEILGAVQTAIELERLGRVNGESTMPKVYQVLNNLGLKIISCTNGTIYFNNCQLCGSTRITCEETNMDNYNKRLTTFCKSCGHIIEECNQGYWIV